MDVFDFTALIFTIVDVSSSCAFLPALTLCFSRDQNGRGEGKCSLCARTRWLVACDLGRSDFVTLVSKVGGSCDTIYYESVGGLLSC